MNDMKIKLPRLYTYRIETEDRYGRLYDYELQATSKAEAEAIAEKPINTFNGSIVTRVVQVKN